MEYIIRPFELTQYTNILTARVCNTQRSFYSPSTAVQQPLLQDMIPKGGIQRTISSSTTSSNSSLSTSSSSNTSSSLSTNSNSSLSSSSSTISNNHNNNSSSSLSMFSRSLLVTVTRTV